MQRAADKIARLCAEPRDIATLWTEVSEVVAGVIPHYWTPCWYTLDPASLLMTSHFHLGLDEFPNEWLAAEYYEDDVHSVVGVMRSAAGISTLHEASGGDPSHSPRWQRNQIMGSDQELIARLRTRSGEVWGALALYRVSGESMFSALEKSFVTEVAPSLADGARRALLFGQAEEPEYADSPGLLVLKENWEIESATPGVARWMDELPDGDWEQGRLPAAVTTLAGRTLRDAEERGRAGEVAVSRVLSRSGTWVVLHGACLTSARERRIAVIVEPAHPSRIYPLLMSAYGLTEREKEVVRLVLQGGSTTDISASLKVSAYTVQQHLKSIFDKTGVHSRRDLVGKVFFTHYEPRFRDNEKRVLADKSVRGGPWPEPDQGIRRQETKPIQPG
ncbi:MAG: putative transcriptional regulator, LuxR family protein [Nocardia sp.]|uniref:helix-turn-helix transcriptional regulator n=1 Tax=Nocardia sp. TaxID=1821 RepID=UPI0026087B71|nr:helix-turn-helix transcriptional regulator [Nocardia sp.]MCU1641310.1 putative transcriptional regulator, LuxR family protein [Nocardia sp.]